MAANCQEREGTWQANWLLPTLPPSTVKPNGKPESNPPARRRRLRVARTLTVRRFSLPLPAIWKSISHQHGHYTSQCGHRKVDNCSRTGQSTEHCPLTQTETNRQSSRALTGLAWSFIGPLVAKETKRVIESDSKCQMLSLGSGPFAKCAPFHGHTRLTTGS